MVLLFGGVAAVLFSFVLPFVFSAELSWSSDKATELNRAGVELQRLVTQGDNMNAAQREKLKKQRAELEEKIATLQSDLEGKVNRPYWMSIVCSALGIVMVAAGWGMYYFQPTQPPPKPKSLAEMDPDYVPEVMDVSALDYTKAIRETRGKKKSAT
jgi:hypothetical protein